MLFMKGEKEGYTFGNSIGSLLHLSRQYFRGIRRAYRDNALDAVPILRA